MSSLYKSPGVHIESAGDRYIPLEKVETGVTAFLGVTEKGPNNEPTRVGSYEQYAKVFGEAEGFMNGAVRGFFDNGGKTAYVLNVAPEGGLDSDELEAFAGAVRLRLGPYVLRSETAPIAAVAVLLSRAREMFGG